MRRAGGQHGFNGNASLLSQRGHHGIGGLFGGVARVDRCGRGHVRRHLFRRWHALLCHCILRHRIGGRRLRGLTLLHGGQFGFFLRREGAVAGLCPQFDLSRLAHWLCGRRWGLGRGLLGFGQRGINLRILGALGGTGGVRFDAAIARQVGSGGLAFVHPRLASVHTAAHHATHVRALASSSAYSFKSVLIWIDILNRCVSKVFSAAFFRAFLRGFADKSLRHSLVAAQRLANKGALDT